ncbi:16S rRNA pseudouridine(516) synthase, partial [Erysipelatoclostridium ramosum]|nr:16S rRNA pseudouridine(516) synthase [Thomasclavelia ramosa]
ELAQSLQEGDQKRLENGSIILDEEPVLPARVEILEDTKILLHIQEGRFHQVKRMLHAVGNEVVYLKRIAMGPLQLDEALACGEWRY